MFYQKYQLIDDYLNYNTITRINIIKDIQSIPHIQFYMELKNTEMNYNYLLNLYPDINITKIKLYNELQLYYSMKVFSEFGYKSFSKLYYNFSDFIESCIIETIDNLEYNCSNFFQISAYLYFRKMNKTNMNSIYIRQTYFNYNINKTQQQLIIDNNIHRTLKKIYFRFNANMI